MTRQLPAGRTTYVPAVLSGRSVKAVHAEIGQRRQLGQVHVPDDAEIRLITRGAHAGQYAIPVYLVRTDALVPRGRISRRTVVAAGGALAVLGGLTALGWWVLSTLTAGPLVAFLLAVLVLFVSQVWRSHGRRPRVTVTTTTTVEWE